MELENFWAKTAKGKPNGEIVLSILDHSLYTGYVAQAALKYIPKTIRENVLPQILIEKNYLVLLAALHDIGKISPFQLKSEKWKAYCKEVLPNLSTYYKTNKHYSHSHYTYYFFTKELNLGDTIATIIASHHGEDIRDCLLLGENKGSPFARGRLNLYQKCAKIFGINTDQIVSDLTSLEIPLALENFLKGWITIVDWIASNETFFPLKQSLPFSEIAEKAKLAVSSLFEIRAKKIIPALSFQELFCEDSSVEWKPNPFQVLAKETIKKPGVYILEAPMGTGKTEAALEAAYTLLDKGYHEGIYFALPTRLTSNHMHTRMERFIGELYSSPVHLVHKNSWMKQPLTYTSNDQILDKGGSDSSRFSWFMPKKRALLFPYGVGTIDQLLLAVLLTKHYAVRYCGLSGKVVILDEIHSYDLYTSELIQSLIKDLTDLQCTVLILSATLTEKKKQVLLEGKTGSCISYTDTSCDLSKEIHIRFKTFSPTLIEENIEENNLKSEESLWKEIATECLEKIEQGYRILWIVNTVRKAQQIFDLLQSEKKEDQLVGLLHSRFPHWRREELEGEYLPFFEKNKKFNSTGFLLLSTQIVEQSLDIDSDLLITELAPTDVILQRLGRLWRHPSQTRPIDSRCEAWIYCVDMNSLEGIAEEKNVESHFQGTQYVYPPYLLYKTWEAWQNKYEFSKKRRHPAILNFPNDISALLEETYSFSENEPCLQSNTTLEEVFYKKYKTIRDKQEREAEKSLSKTFLDNPSKNKSCPTRWNTVERVNILLVKEAEETKPKGLKIQPLFGNEFFMDKFTYCYEGHVLILKNLVSIPINLLCNKNLSDQWLKNSEQYYFGETFYIGRVTEKNSISIEEVETSLTWSPHKGIEKIETVTQIRSSIDESDE